MDERVNINDLIQTGGFSLFYVHSVDKCYSSFKIKQIDLGSNNQWGFSLAAFDIHGIIYSKDNSDKKYEFVYENTQDDSFDPCFDMTEYM